MPDYTFGTVFGDRGLGMPAGQIQYFLPIGPWVIFAGYAKETDNSYSAVSSQGHFIQRLNASRNDRDLDSYRIAGIFNFNTSQAKGETGALFLYNRDATHRGEASGAFMSNIYAIDPYVKAKIGPVALQAEVTYFFGDGQKYDNGTDVQVNALTAFVDATVDLGPVYVGGSIAYLEGDDPGTTDKIEGGIAPVSGGLDWNPCLIMFNTETLGYWVGDIVGHSGTVLDSEMTNAWFFQGRVGVKPMPKLDVMMSASYAMVDKKPTGINGGSYGTEIDVTGTYKITNNLSYMLGIGYLFTGDYFKGSIDDQPRRFGNPKVDDDFIIINKLTLSF
jgi:hypothetical protein